MSTEVDDFLAHYGIKGMKWGVRRTDAQIARANKESYADRAYRTSAGASKTKVTTKNGETITIEKGRIGPLAVAVGKLTGRDPSEAVSQMTIRNKDGKEVGSFQVWKEGNNAARGEWLSVNKAHQGRGYSEAAIKGLMEAAKNDKSIREVRLEVPSDAAAAKHIYTKLGFKKDVDLGETLTFGNIEDWVYKV